MNASHSLETDCLVIDDLVPTKIFRILSRYLAGPIWRYGHYSNARRDRYCFWNADFSSSSASNRSNCEDALFESKVDAVSDVWLHLKEGLLKDHELLRIYANAHTYGVEGFIHLDSEDTENYFTTVIYAHPVWHPNWGGEFLFFNSEQNEVIKTVVPKPGRLIHFRGSIPHCARAISRDCAELRVSLVIKTQRPNVSLL